MSAAAPNPPPHRSSIPSQPAGQAHDRNGAAPPARPQSSRPMLHMSDIVAKAENSTHIQEPIARLLERAQTSLSQASSYLEFYNRPDIALLEFLIAGNIVIDIIPKHKDLPRLRGENPRLTTLYGQLIRAYKADEKRFENVKEFIKADNKASGVRPQSSSSSDAKQSATSSPPPTPPLHSPRPQSVQSPPPSSPSTGAAPSTIKNGAGGTQNSHRNSIAFPAPPSTSIQGRQKPPLHPKPEKLHGNAITPNGHNGPSSDDLNARFARLRSNTSSSSASSIMTNGTATTTSTAASSPTKRKNSIPASSLSKQLPKPPSPTYSPARSPAPTSSGVPTTAQSPRSSILMTSSDSPVSATSLPFHHLPSNYSSSTTTAAKPDGSTNNDARPVPRRRRTSEHRPQETQISAERLFDYMKTFNVLLIDVRAREDYDGGHIFSQSVICVEPVALRPNMSAEELVESLVISPDAEPELFERRDEFDLVVYYDQSTDNAGFLQEEPGSNLSLKYLRDTLGDFNQEKPLSWQPILLTGGMDAWVDLLGPNALLTSNTAAAAREKSAKSERSKARRPAGSEDARLNLQKKRHREYNPLAPEEERKWRERARSESVVLQPPPETEPQEVAERLADQTDVGFADFQSRYPDVETVERQNQLARPPSRPPPDVPRIPAYPETPIPSVPSRPPPAVPRPSYSGVSERMPSQSSSISKSSQLAPYIPPQLMRLPKTGLHNFGVTCYMNATIQCLSATIPLTAFFFEGRFQRFIQQDNWKGSKGLMPELYNTLLLNLWRSNDNDTIRPTNFRKFCARLNREWGIDRQQDAKEFLEFLIDTLHEDLNVNWATAPHRALTEEQEAVREKMPQFLAAKIEWEQFTDRDSSRLTQLFGGQTLSRLQCMTCRQTSTTYETFYAISVEIPTPTSKKRPVHLDDCMRSYCSDEVLSHRWRCPRCKTNRQASKRFTITRAPQFLVIHLKRFSASHSEKAKKVHTPVDFPLTGFDLEPYMLPSPDSQTKAMVERTHGPKSVEASPSMTPPYKYDAYAVMRHIGSTMGSGHYTALVEDKARGCWREFNDDKTTDFQPDQLSTSRSLQNEQAYILFYQRVN